MQHTYLRINNDTEWELVVAAVDWSSDLNSVLSNVWMCNYHPLTRGSRSVLTGKESVWVPVKKGTFQSPIFSEDIHRETSTEQPLVNYALPVTYYNNVIIAVIND